MTNSERAKKTAEKNRSAKRSMALAHFGSDLSTDEYMTEAEKVIVEDAQNILSALNEAVKEVREDTLRLLASTDETVALHSEFTGKYRGI